MEKIKQFIESDKGKDILIILIIILVGLGSFGLGRLSKNDQNSGLKIEYDDQEANAINSIDLNNLSNLSSNPNFIPQNKKIIPSSGNFFASNRGSKYYSTSCSAGKTIKQENRVYFTTREEAEEAGYELSNSCR